MVISQDRNNQVNGMNPITSHRNSSSSAINQMSNSPSNGHLSETDSSISDESDHGMRVGSDYQAFVPDKSSILPKPAPDSEPDHAVLVWSPTNSIPDDKLDAYIALAKEKYSYNAEQALGMLCWHKFDLEKALADLPNFTPFPDEWTVEDKVLFEQAFQFHDKNFHKIKQMLPDKAIASLVKYYYSWKKTRTRTSLMDRQARRLTVQKDDASDNGSDGGSENENELGNGKLNANETGGNNGNSSSANNGEGKTRCENCFTTASGQFHNTNKGILCRACYSYWRRTGLMRSSNGNRKHNHSHTNHANNLSTSTGTSTGGVTGEACSPRSSNTNLLMKSKREPPRGIYLNFNDLLTLASSTSSAADALLKSLDDEVIGLKRQVQNNKQIISQIKHRVSAGVSEYRLNEPNPTRINSRWTSDETLLAVQGIRKYGKDFKAIAEVIGNKSEAQIRTFFVNNERRYSLNNILKEYEQEHQSVANSVVGNNNESMTNTGNKTTTTTAATTGGSGDDESSTLSTVNKRMKLDETMSS